MENKKQLGKYYTVSNPFTLQIFQKWFRAVPDISNLTILEPFAGSNNIVKLMSINNNWECYDIKPTKNLTPKFKIKKRDTIKDFPKGYKIAITNPPYLAKNSATRRNMTYQGDPYDDLYKKCLEQMLANLEYVAAIIPESFITSGLFRERLDCVISLTCKMFDDTDCPVCLALFSPNITQDFEIYRMDNRLGSFSEMAYNMLIPYNKFSWNMYDPTGEIGLIGIDNTTGPSIKFVEGSIIDSSKIKKSSRSITRISCNVKINDLPMFLQICNNFLNIYRNNTGDIFMTSFKGLRKDGLYRRRLDFNTAQIIMEKVLLTYKGI